MTLFDFRGDEAKLSSTVAAAVRLFFAPVDDLVVEEGVEDAGADSDEVDEDEDCDLLLLILLLLLPPPLVEGFIELMLGDMGSCFKVGRGSRVEDDGSGAVAGL